MVQRIALLIGFFILSSGFVRPEISGSHGIYRFEPPSTSNGTVFISQAGGVFSVTVGFKQNAAMRQGLSHKLKAEALLDLVANMRFPKAEIRISKIYSGISEVVLNVKVADPAQTEKVRASVIKILQASPHVAFAGNYTQAEIQ
jgi:hypothetical protein